MTLNYDHKSIFAEYNGIIYRQASTGSSVLLETLQEMAENQSSVAAFHRALFYLTCF